MRRTLLLILTTALVASGCGMLTDPSVSSPDEVLDGLFAARDGARARVTASLEVDEGEVRRALRGDAEARELFRGLVDDRDLGDPDALLADLAEVQELLDQHAVLVGFGDDHSGRIAAEHAGGVWADVRFRQLPLDPEDPAAGVSFDLQGQVDWEAAAAALEQPDLPGEVATAAEEAAAFLDDLAGAELPDLGGVRDLVLGFLTGELVAIGGEVTPELLAPFGLSPDMLAGGLGAGALGPGLFGVPLGQSEAAALGGVPLDLDAREFAATALSFSDYRRDGAVTLVDVSLEVRAAGNALLDALEDDPSVLGLTTEDLQEARARLDQVPERLQDVAVLRFDDEGALAGLRIDLLDLALQLARAADDDDLELATVERVAAELDATGFFVDLAFTDVGAVDTVLADDPTTTVGVAELVELVGTYFLGGLAGDGSMFTDEEQLDAVADVVGGGAPATAFDPAAYEAGDCFDDTVFFDADAPATVDCAGPHDNEVLGTVSFGSFDEALDAAVLPEACLDLFAQELGVPHGQSELLVDVAAPPADAFTDGPADGICYVSGFEPLTGSATGGG